MLVSDRKDTVEMPYGSQPLVSRRAERLLDRVMEEGSASKGNAQVQRIERRIHAEFIEDMNVVMEKDNITSSQLAEAMGADPSVVTRLRNPGKNVTLNTLARVMWILGPENFRLIRGARKIGN